MGETAAGGELHVAYVLSAGHSGSTLLSLLLNAHSRIHALSEIDKLGEYARGERGRALDNAFWRDVAARYEAASGRSFVEVELRRPPRAAGAAALDATARDYACVAHAIAETAGKRILVDASKDGDQLEVALAAPGLSVCVLHLLRDGRGVVHSYARKYGSFARGYRHWRTSLADAQRMRERVPPARWLTLRYEDLARRPEAQLRRACAFLGVEFEPAMLAFRAATWEGISGNRVARGAGEEIALDERWRRERGWAERVAFAALGGRRNARNGY